MPEGDTIQRQTDWLRSIIGTKSFQEVKIHGKKTGGLDVTLFQPQQGKPLLKILCKGKRFFWRFTEDLCLSFHHMMKGHWSLEKEAHTLLEIVFGDEEDSVHIYYNNARFGGYEVYTTSEMYQEKLDALAPGFIGEFKMDLAEFKRRMNRFSDRKNIRRALMEQDSLCSGIGNFLVAEIMYYAEIHPKATKGDLSPEEIENLYNACELVVTSFYEKTLEKVIYKHEVCPEGYKIKTCQMSGRTVWYVPDIQTIGAPQED